MPAPNVVRIEKKPPPPPKRPPILWTRVLMGFALNVMVVTLGMTNFGQVVNGPLWVLAGSALFGILTCLLIPQRAGIHVFLAGMLSAPFLAIFILPAPLAWQYAFLSGGVFALAGLLVDPLRRVRG